MKTDTSLRDKKILLFAPTFFGYEKDIAEGLRKLGAQVTYYDDRPDNKTSTKGFIRTNRKLVARKIDNYYQGIIDGYEVNRFDLLIFINPESITPSLLSQLRARQSTARVILYMWDSFKNKKQSAELIPLTDSAYSFDRSDSAEYGINFRPLFYVEDYGERPDTAVYYDTCFIGTAHSDRHRMVKVMENSVANAGFKKNYSFFYISSYVHFIFRKIKEREFRVIRRADVSFVSMNKSEVSNMVHASRFVIDIQHPGQTGLTMRTFEALGAQKKVITTNKEVVGYDFYHPDNIMVVDRRNPLISEAWLNAPFRRYTPGLLKKYSLEGWLREITGMVLSEYEDVHITKT